MEASLDGLWGVGEKVVGVTIVERGLERHSKGMTA